MWTRIRCSRCRTNVSSVRALLTHTNSVDRRGAPERASGVRVEVPDAPHEATATDAPAGNTGDRRYTRHRMRAKRPPET